MENWESMQRNGYINFKPFLSLVIRTVLKKKRLFSTPNCFKLINYTCELVNLCVFFSFPGKIKIVNNYIAAEVKSASIKTPNQIVKLYLSNNWFDLVHFEYVSKCGVMIDHLVYIYIFCYEWVYETWTSILSMTFCLNQLNHVVNWPNNMELNKNK